MKEQNVACLIIKSFVIAVSLSLDYSLLNSQQLHNFVTESTFTGLQLAINKFAFFFYPNKISAIPVLGGIYCLLLLTNRIPLLLKKTNIFLSGLFSLCLIIGISYNTFESLQIFYSGALNLLLAAVAFIGFFMLAQIIFKIIFYLLNCVIERLIPQRKSSIIFSGMEHSLLKRPFIFSMGVMLLAWLPYCILLFPGTISYDAYTQISQALGYVPLSTHHPPFMTGLMGAAVYIGRKFANDNAGLFVFVFLQTIFQAVVCAYTFVILKRIQVSEKCQKYLLIFFAFFPMFPLNAMAMNKDGLFSSVFMLFVLMIIEAVLIEEADYRPRKLVFIFLILFLLTLSRNNGIHIIFLTLPFLIIVLKKKYRKQWIALFFCVILGSQMAAKIVYPAIGFEKGSVVEALSVPLQQMARYVKYHKEEISKEDEKRIRRILHYDTLDKDYDPNLSDPIKSYVSYSVLGATKIITADDLKEFSIAWLHGLEKHPLTYVEATIGNTSNYYCLNTVDNLGYEGYYRLSPINKLKKHYHFSSPKLLMRGADLLEGFWLIVRNLPGIALLFTTGFYVWTVLLMVMFMIGKKCYRGIILFFPSIAIVISCLLSPQNGNARYMRPVMLTIWIVIIAALKYMQECNTIDGEMVNEERDK